MPYGTLFLLLALAAQAPGEGPQWEFERDVRGLFRAQCVVCHGPERAEGRLRLDVQDQLLDAERALVVPGKPEESELLHRLRASDPDDRMPKDRAALSPVEIDRLAAWIADGAKWSVADGRLEHWAWQTPTRAPLPTPRDAGWCRNPIDRFVLARLEKEGLAPSPEADRATLARRLALDLTGLPPSPAEVEALERDDGSDSVERLVERLLVSPRHAEQMAFSWLDLARYADTNGYEKDDRRTMWPWRDALIASFAADQRFDQFTLEAIAGDLLPNATRAQIVASAFHRNTLVNQEGGVDPEEFRCAAVIDRANTTASVWLATTLGCAQCHDHKYDPISQADYFRFYACFDDTADDGRGLDPTLALPTPDEERQLAEIANRRAALADALNHDAAALEREERAWVNRMLRELDPPPAWIVLLPERATASAGSQLAILPDGSVLASGKPPASETYTLDLGVKERVRARIVRIEALVDPSLPRKGPGRAPNGNFVLSELELALDGQPLTITECEADHVQQQGGSFPLRDAFDGDPRTGWAGDAAAAHTTRTALFLLSEPAELRPGARLSLRLTQASPFDAHLLGRVRVSTCDDAALAGALRLPESTGWEGAPPIPVESTPAGLAARLGLEPGEARAVEWSVRPEHRDGHAVELPGERIAHFLRRRFVVNEPMSLRFAFGGDDAFRAWLDGELIASSEEWPGNLPAQRRVEQSLVTGEHELRVKVVNSSGPGQFWFDWDRKTRERVPEDLRATLRRSDAEWSTEERKRVHAHWLGQASQRYVEVEEERLRLDAREKAVRDSMLALPVMRGLEKPRVTRVFEKGSFLSPGDVVEPGAPAFLPAFPKDAPKNRLGLARWLVDPSNPLTARVAVNRVWERLVGRGLVATTDDFGTRGELPSHPELLDWLALDFVEHGWSFRHLVRRITSSATYRQASRFTKALLERDPDNVLLARSSAWRLDGEVLRDVALANAELLSTKIGGPSVMPPQPDGVWAPVYSDDAWKTSSGEDRFRRGLYTFWKRSSPYATFALFDAPSRELCAARRPRTNTPLQALALLNDPVFVECAAGLAERMRRESTGEPRAIARRGFVIAASREPEAEELELLLRLHERELAHERTRAPGVQDGAPAPDGDGPAQRAVRLKRLDADPEHRAWTRVASVLLNLDEAITRR